MTTDSYTRWERAQHAADNGQMAAIAQGYKALGAYLAEHGQRDRDILGIGKNLPPDPVPYLLPVTHGTPAERMAAVAAFAAEHGTTAGWDRDHYKWQAVVMFGPIRYVAYMIPEQVPVQPVPAPREDAPVPVLAGKAA